MDKILDVKNLEVSFQTYFGEVEAVRNISFSLERGKTLGIVGESGCGKSVTANSILQLLPKPPAVYKGGEILFNGENLLDYTENQMTSIRGNKISMIFQDPMTSLNPTMKVGKQITESVRRHKKISHQEAEKLALETLQKVAVPQAEKRINQYPFEFSGGMRQRAMIALAMVNHPELLIADEPTTALDVTIQAQIMDLMKQVKKEFNTSIILITHDLGVVADMADEIIVMYAGQIVEKGTATDIFEHPKHPYTIRLLESIPRLDMDREDKLRSIEGSPPDLYKPPKGCGFFDRCHKAMQICEEHDPEMTFHSEGHCSKCWLNHPEYLRFTQKEHAHDSK